MEKTKICPKCGKSKSLEKGFAKNKNRKDGRQGWCRACQREWKRGKQKDPQYRVHSASYMRDWRRDRIDKHHLGECQICGGAESLTFDRQEGRLRGILCRDCQVGLKRFRENLRLLQRAGLYLVRFESGSHVLFEE